MPLPGAAPTLPALGPGVVESLIMMSINHNVLILITWEPSIEESDVESSHVNDHSCLLWSEELSDCLVAQRIEVSKTSLGQSSSTLITTDVGFIEETNTI